MTKPSILQKLLSQPSQSYSAPPSSFDSDYAYRSKTTYASSVRTSSSRAGSAHNRDGDDRANGNGNWDWSNLAANRMGFGRPKGGTASLRSARSSSSIESSDLGPPSRKAGGSRDGERRREDDRRGIREVRSVGSFNEPSREREREATSRAGSSRLREQQLDEREGNVCSSSRTERASGSSRQVRVQERSSSSLSQSRRYSSTSDMAEFDQPSRRYASMDSPPRTTPPTISITASTPDPPVRHYAPRTLDDSPRPRHCHHSPRGLDHSDDDSSLPYLKSPPHAPPSNIFVEYTPPASSPSSPPSSPSPKRRSHRSKEREREASEGRPTSPFGLFVVEEGTEQDELIAGCPAFSLPTPEASPREPVKNLVSQDSPSTVHEESETESMTTRESVYYDADGGEDEARPESLYFEFERDSSWKSLRDASAASTKGGSSNRLSNVPATVEETVEDEGQATPKKEALPPSSPPIPIGRTLTMDEFFSLAQASSPPQVVSTKPSPASPPSPVPRVDSTSANLNTSDETINQFSHVKQKSPLPLPLKRLSDSTNSFPSSSAPSSRSSIVSSILSATDLSTVPTDLTHAKFEIDPTPYTRAEKGKAKEMEVVTSSASTPARDQIISPSETIQPPAVKKRHLVGEKRVPNQNSVSRSTSLSSRHSSYEVVASSKLTTANLVSSTRTAAPTSAAQDTPSWLKNIRALGEPIEPLASFKSAPGPTNNGIQRSQSMLVAHRHVTRTRKEGSETLRMETMLEESVNSSNAEVTLSRTNSNKSFTDLTGGARTPRRRKKSGGLRSPSPQNSSAHSLPLVVEPSTTPAAEPIQTLTPYYPPASAPSRDVARPRAVSLFSATSAGAKSVSGLSSFSVPTAPYRPIANAAPQRVSMLGSETLVQASTAMNALSVCSNATAALRRSTFSVPSLFGRSKPPQWELPPHLAAAAFVPSRDLSFGMLKPPPSKLKSGEVLVEVHAVAVDQWDWERAAEMAAKVDASGFGWVPGRSFCGRAMECGFDVNKVKRGDLVFGLADLKRSGALAELLVVDRDRLTLAPACDISVEEIAALPLSGVAAVQIMESLCAVLPRGSKILILSAHEGVGNLCSQVAFHYRPSRDLWVVAQCPITVQDGESYCRMTGASEVILDEPLAALNSQHESSFDVVIDTLGGQRLYDASRRILHSQGHFVTTVGDAPTLATTSTQFKTGIRSLRRTFFKKDKKAISYWAVTNGDDERESTRETLEKLRRAVEESAVRPTVRRVIGFGEAEKAFEEGAGGSVVRVLEIEGII